MNPIIKVSYAPAKSPKVKFVTNFALTVGTLTVGTGTLAGRYNPEQALREVKRNPKRVVLDPLFKPEYVARLLAA